MKKTQLLFLLLFLSFSSFAQQRDIEELLSNLPDLSFEKTNDANCETRYVLHVKQPIDHSDASRGFFRQKVYLSHKGFDKPTVMITEGYNAYPTSSELTDLLDANQLQVEHRYFGESMPDSLDYRFLNLKQATADLHHIRQIFDKIYSEKWISTGISKGGATTIFYRYFYPNDVDVSVPYVAPINTSYEEPRIYDFLSTVGSDDCRHKIKDFQIKVLQHRDEIMPLLKFWSLMSKTSYTYLTMGEAFEYAVMEYPFSFWQYGADCEGIPSKNAELEELTAYFLSVSDISFFSDQAIERFSSHYYQSATEMGYYGYDTKALKDYLVELPTDANPMALFFPFEMKDKFNGQLLQDVNRWLKTKANKFIYIYGDIDTWSASAVPPNDKVDAKWFMLKGKHHGNARIKSMTPEEKERLITTLEKWLEIEISPKKIDR